MDNITLALEELGERIADEMRNRLFENKSVITGDLARSITTFIKEDNEAQSLAISLLWYGQELEDGGPARRAGKFPPPAPIAAWIKRTPGIQPKPGVTMDQLVYLISRKIAKKGSTYPKKPFIMPSINQALQNYGNKAIEQAAGVDITNEITVAFEKTGATVM
jgi:hypothetical protein